MSKEQCDCPKDWVACIASNCPRARAIRKARDDRLVYSIKPTQSTKGPDQ